MKKILSAFMATIMLALLITSSALAAQETKEAQETKAGNFGVTEELIRKADPYVTLVSKKFILSENASNTLTKQEIEIVKKALEQANAQVEKIPVTQQLTVTERNSLKASSQSVESDIGPQSINTSAYWDYELLWWGYRIFLSHQLTEDIKARALYIGGISAISGGALAGIFAALGVPTWIASIVVGVFAVKGAQIVYADNGNGVYIDTFWTVPGIPGGGGLNFLLSKVYAA
ncbi:hypothetical protein [Paenibacillus ehimensis]|uniref:Uncharacterized protein n=1 Tax=Paenibacillus ehimensis TaxID=79264 RepID=A0ABT8VFV0_9BACL|nr:hypothetical protein [Paenibacillus ehimensis]MDO3679824.1 hypothetical protein [Paenibacillus ehimensis]